MAFSFQRSYTLKQQTPLIHFQYNQDGAVLRATEVKPKLDKFIIRMMGRDSIPEDWYINREKHPDALNYKIRFLGEQVQSFVLQDNRAFNIYYGNTDEGVYAQKVTVTVTCFIPGLLEKINEQIGDFFVLHNFGRMQRKGFGSFCIVGRIPNENDIKEKLCLYYHTKACYSFKPNPRNYNPNCNCLDNAVNTKLFPHIKIIYSIMKSGINFGGYRRSLLFLYMHEKKQLGNEKAWLKQNGMAPTNVGPHAEKGEPSEADLQRDLHRKRYVRALLGVGDHVDFLNDLKNRRNKTTINIRHARIKRYRSPILFKVINGQVYFVGENIEENNCVLGQTFTFNQRNLSTPTGGEIGPDFLDDFLQYCCVELNRSQDDLNRRYPGAGYKALTGFGDIDNNLRITEYRRREGGGGHE